MGVRLNGSTQYLESANGIITAVPITMSIWMNADDETDFRCLMTMGDTDYEALNWFRLSARGDTANDPVQFTTAKKPPLVYGEAEKTNFAASTWHHVCGKSGSTSSRYVYLDGVVSAEETTDVDAPLSIDNFVIGVLKEYTNIEAYFDGIVAEAAVWNVALSDAEVGALAHGFSPLFIRPESLFGYWPLIRDIKDVTSNGYNLTAYNSPTYDVHPPVIYPATPLRPGMPIADLTINVSDCKEIREIIG
jgi:hypothetical protein